jgi:ABC-type polysaccharide/polyol phosphate transport system ATPase subunit
MAPATEATLPALELSGVTVEYAVPNEVIVSLKEYAIRKLQGRVEHGQLVALKDVSFTVRAGERVGVIGPNGAGKSTLFRVIARVRRPTEGRVVVRGKVAPLLELGLGFHGELTGRENVILHGTLMGVSRREMVGRMAAIAAFAELEPFLDAPMRTYSTGMAARLAFAVATDVDPDVLLVDEALSVGDERFRSKCRERMEGFRERGRTFLLVSHSLADVMESCQRAIWLLEGRVIRDGAAEEVCAAYHDWAQSGEAAPPG